MKVYNFRLRAKHSEEFCNALDRGKCCFKKNEVGGFCKLHNEVFQLLSNGEEITPNSSFKIEYQPHIAKHPTKCVIIEILDAKKSDFYICKNQPFQDGICERHYNILMLLGLMPEFKRSKLYDDIP